MKRGLLGGVKSVIRVSKVRSVIAGAALASMVIGCTDSDIFFGNDMIPESQIMTTKIDSTMKLKSSIMAVDSVTTSGTSIISIGKYWNPTYGYTKTEGIASFNHAGFKLEDKFGTKPTLDSMHAFFYVYAPIGDTADKVVINVYDLKDIHLSYRGTYRSNTDITKYRGDNYLGQFEVSGTDSVVTFKLPESFYSKLLYDGYNDENSAYSSDSLFIDKYRGLYFELENDEYEEGKEGLMYWIDMNYSSMMLYFHNQNEEPDTTFTSYYFDNDMVLSGNRFYTIEHDYSLADPSQGGIDVNLIGDTTLNVDQLYLQGMGGLGGRIEIDTTFINNLKAEAKDLGFSSVALHRASIKWQFEEKQADAYNLAPLRLGLYYNIADTSCVADYSPISENMYGTVSDLDGNVNRSHGYYEQVITSTLQKLFSKPDDVPYTVDGEYKYVVELLPSWNELAIYSQALLGGGSSQTNAPEIVLTYTLVK